MRGTKNMSGIKEKLTNKLRRKAEEFGGADEFDYDAPDPDKKHYSDKGSHRLRSEYHRPAHKKRKNR